MKTSVFTRIINETKTFILSEIAKTHKRGRKNSHNSNEAILSVDILHLYYYVYSEFLLFWCWWFFGLASVNFSSGSGGFYGAF